jgi:signal transduction histidine kinase
MELHVKPSDVEQLITEAVDHRRAIIGDGGNQLRLLIHSAPTKARIDSNQLKKVIDAILENAAQHTVNGAITVGSGQMLKDGREYFSVSVEDTGSGISADMLPSIMESFALNSNASSGRYGGTGLSLTVASKLCQVMGGYIDVSSRVGRGSKFTVVLPLETEELARGSPTAPDRASAS